MTKNIFRSTVGAGVLAAALVGCSDPSDVHIDATRQQYNITNSEVTINEAQPQASRNEVSNQNNSPGIGSRVWDGITSLADAASETLFPRESTYSYTPRAQGAPPAQNLEQIAQAPQVQRVVYAEQPVNQTSNSPDLLELFVGKPGSGYNTQSRQTQPQVVAVQQVPQYTSIQSNLVNQINFTTLQYDAAFNERTNLSKDYARVTDELSDSLDDFLKADRKVGDLTAKFVGEIGDGVEDVLRATEEGSRRSKGSEITASEFGRIANEAEDITKAYGRLTNKQKELALDQMNADQLSYLREAIHTSIQNTTGMLDVLEANQLELCKQLNATGVYAPDAADLILERKATERHSKNSSYLSTGSSTRN